jgi:hypothetical protein
MTNASAEAEMALLRRFFGDVDDPDVPAERLAGYFADDYATSTAARPRLGTSRTATRISRCAASSSTASAISATR